MSGPRDHHELASLIFLAVFVTNVAGVVYHQICSDRTLCRAGVPIGK